MSGVQSAGVCRYPCWVQSKSAERGESREGVRIGLVERRAAIGLKEAIRAAVESGLL
jgi:hypothetical protein